MPSMTAAVPAGDSALWIHNRKFDLLFLSLSGVLVFFPYVSYGLLQKFGLSEATSSLIVGLSVTLLVGGPHMYGPIWPPTQPFPKRHPMRPPAARVTRRGRLDATVHPALTGFFLWASIHVTHQAQYISETYRMRAGAPIRPLDRWLDGGIILGALYLMAMYKFVADKFALGSSVLLFPEFLKSRWVAVAFTVGYAIFFLFYVVRTFGEIRRGETSWPRLVFMTMTVAMAFVVPLFDNLDVSFQGFNTWHSLQYLALTWFILGRQAENGQLGSGFARALAGKEKTKKFYFAMVGATVSAGVIYLILWKGLNFPQDKSYYVVVLSFLLVHYFYTVLSRLLASDLSGGARGPGSRKR